jgi:hypothetical protein
MSHLQPASQEADQIRARLPLGITAWVLVFGALLCVVAVLVLLARSHTLERAPSVASVQRPEPEVHNIRTELFRSGGAADRLKADQRRALQHYGWVDRQRGIVRIPIDVAMDLESHGVSR